MAGEVNSEGPDRFRFALAGTRAGPDAEPLAFERAQP
jgi:hypothetical protein